MAIYDLEIIDTSESVGDKAKQILLGAGVAIDQNGRLSYLLSQELADQLLELVHLSNGIVTKENSSFNRMFYFSAVTITTLGYGDIVPVTRDTRMLVGSQSIIGILLIGMFLNSLSREGRKWRHF